MRIVLRQTINVYCEKEVSMADLIDFCSDGDMITAMEELVLSDDDWIDTIGDPLENMKGRDFELCAVYDEKNRYSVDQNELGPIQEQFEKLLLLKEGV